MQPTLTTSRLTLRPYTFADAPAVQRLAGDARIADTTTTIPHPYPDDAAQAWIATHSTAWLTKRATVFAVTRYDGDQLLGTVSLLDIAPHHHRAELGFWIGADYWSQGYCTEAVNCLIDFAQTYYGVTRIAARCLARNPASARVMEKAGLHYEGRLVQDMLKNGRYEDVLLYGRVLSGRGEASAA